MYHRSLAKIKVLLPILMIGFLFTHEVFAETIQDTPPATRSEYIAIGMPNVDHFWTEADYRLCRNAMASLLRTNRAMLPRIQSPESGLFFDRLVNATNILVLTDRRLPSKQRITLFYELINRYPFFRECYKLTGSDITFQREAIELAHGFLQLAGMAIEFDGKSIPAGPDEKTETVFKYQEAFFSATDVVLGKGVRDVAVASNGDFNYLAGECSLTIMGLIPWLSDKAGLQEEERFRAIRNFQKDVPFIWKHIVPESQKTIIGYLKTVTQRTEKTALRNEMNALCDLLK